MGSTVENYSIVISGDTTINSVTYHKLTTPYIQAVMLGTCTANYAGYKGAFRNDVANKKVFYVPPSNSIEQLLYDFTMQVGDTVKGFLETFTFPSDIVNSIDSVLVGSNYRKRWNIDPCYYVSIIEGIGSTYGLVQPSPGCFVDQANYWLTCFSQNNFTLYPDTTANCQLITTIENINDNHSSIEISPNPFHSYSYLKVSSEFENAEIKMYNALGLLMREEKISRQEFFLLNRDKLQNGIYFIQLINDKSQLINKKFVVD
jgi:hypothetical protein